MANETQEPPFWLVWAEDGGQPTVKHPSPEAAEAEARRLAKLIPGKRFFVLWPFLAVTEAHTLVERFDTELYIPF